MGEPVLWEGAMRQNAGVGHVAKPFLHAPCYYSRAEALQINERSRELCLAAAKISRRAERLVEASRALVRMSRELLSEVKAAKTNGHESAGSD
jgi:hypothetical protein